MILPEVAKLAWLLFALVQVGGHGGADHSNSFPG